MDRTRTSKRSRSSAGCPRRLVPDNLRTGVDRTDLYDPKINRSYAELAAHYGALVDPARAPQAPRQGPRGTADALCPGLVLAGPRVHLARPHAGRRAGLVPRRRRDAGLPAAVRRRAGIGVRRARGARRCNRCRAKPFVLATWSTARVGPDIHAKVGKTIYSIPWRYLGQRVDARSTPSVVQFFHQGTLIATHGRKPQGKQTDLSHYPPEKIAFPMRTPTWCRTRAAEIGPACRHGHRRPAAKSTPCSGCAPRKASSAWPTKHSPARLEAACAKAIAVGDPSYRTVKGILIAGAETDPPPPADRRRRRRRAPARPFAAVRERHHPAHHERRARHGPGHHERAPRTPGDDELPGPATAVLA